MLRAAEGPTEGPDGIVTSCPFDILFVRDGLATALTNTTYFPASRPKRARSRDVCSGAKSATGIRLSPSCETKIVKWSTVLMSPFTSQKILVLSADAETSRQLSTPD